MKKKDLMHEEYDAACVHAAFKYNKDHIDGHNRLSEALIKDVWFLTGKK